MHEICIKLGGILMTVLIISRLLIMVFIIDYYKFSYQESSLNDPFTSILLDIIFKSIFYIFVHSTGK